MSTALSRLAAGWQRFWFEPQQTSSLALFRIAFGIVATTWTATLLPNLLAFYGPQGILLHARPGDPGAWSILRVSDSPILVLGVFIATLTASIALTLGLFTRVAAVVVWIGIVSFQQRNILVTNSGDGLVRDLAFFCALAPAGAALSIDRRRKAPSRFWDFPLRAPWALRLIQIQLSVGYLSAVWHKAQNELWSNGTAVSYALRMEDIDRLTTPAFVTHSVVLINLLTFGTMAVELSLGVLVWTKTARPWVLLLGITLHLGIDSSILVGFFSYAMLTGYLAFVAPETASRVVLASRDLLRRSYRGVVAKSRPLDAARILGSGGLTEAVTSSSAPAAKHCVGHLHDDHRLVDHPSVVKIGPLPGSAASSAGDRDCSHTHGHDPGRATAAGVG